MAFNSTSSSISFLVIEPLCLAWIRMACFSEIIDSPFDQLFGIMNYFIPIWKDIGKSFFSCFKDWILWALFIEVHNFSYSGLITVNKT